MRSRIFWIFHLVLLVTLMTLDPNSWLANAQTNNPSSPNPNIILIVTDNQNSSLLGAYGNREINTPRIDQLAREGMLFSNAFAASGVCSPTRAALLTGL